MPAYEFACAKCRHVFTVEHRMSAAPRPSCPKCGSKDVEQRFSAFYAKTIKKS
jgi:putative FmdB family regulatory protein